MNDKIKKQIEEDKRLQKIIWKEYLKTFDMYISYGVIGTVLFFSIFFIVLKPIVFIPITVIAVIIEIKAIFGKKYSLDIYEVKEIYTNFNSEKDKYIECVITKPGNKNYTGYFRGKIIKERNENIEIDDLVVGISVEDKKFVVKAKDDQDV